MDYFLTSIFNSPTPLPPTILSVSSFTEKRKESEHSKLPPSHLPTYQYRLSVFAFPPITMNYLYPYLRPTLDLCNRSHLLLLSQRHHPATSFLSPELSFFPPPSWIIATS